MRKIQFNECTINEIRKYAEEGYTVQQLCNKFTLKPDTLRRVLFENNIKPKTRYEDWNRKCIMVYSDLDQIIINEICHLYSCTDITINDICKTVKVPDYMVQVVLNKHFSQDYRDSRKSRLYKNSKLGDKNPMKGKYREDHPNYKGLVEDGKGYMMILKPDWYTGKQGSRHIYYHHYVVCEALGLTQIPKGYVVHHIDYNKKNNDISNLALMTMGAHTRLHSIEKKMQGAETIHKGVGY